MDEDGQNLLMWKSEDLEKLNNDAESYMLLESGGNSDQDPGLKPDKDYYEKFTNFAASKPGKLNMDLLNKWRRSVGLPLQAEPGSPRKNWGMVYPLKSVTPNLESQVAGVGASSKAPCKEYMAAAAVDESKDYKEVTFTIFKKGAAEVKNLKGQAVMFKAGMGDSKYAFILKSAPRTDYDCVMLLKPGEKVVTRNFVYGYLLKGSEAHKTWRKYLKKRDNYNEAGGIVIKGEAWYAGSDAYTYPAGVVIDTISRR
jgi:hypothetical protein